MRAQLSYYIKCRCCGVDTEHHDGDQPLCSGCKRSLQRHCGPSDQDPSWPMVEWAAKRAVRLAGRKKVK